MILTFMDEHFKLYLGVDGVSFSDGRVQLCQSIQIVILGVNDKDQGPHTTKYHVHVKSDGVEEVNLSREVPNILFSFSLQKIYGFSLGQLQMSQLQVMQSFQNTETSTTETESQKSHENQ